ncbi:hypothetical protein TraAM80_03719 [Trypanosoma rangeli]|uniref:Uncharacterized protein n=1 Tax=Trypanosoma rangeli TaxID=5698 RepID=A0A3R7RM69_TRYRA|nr:uncharacterized protein TraAM80_03719 [Trypanosoma rangeli]RNF06903.1 hypothetical protein TraAM80_03719 [Trypanosoma rangeli]|eukprot:RNF06903.1 hypothetical protein TraAM80_03719 [Trypanosoma rangeli]
MRRKTCHEASPAPLLQLPSPVSAAGQEAHLTEWWSYDNHSSRLAARPNESPVPQRVTATEDRWPEGSDGARVHRALSWSPREECGQSRGATARHGKSDLTPPRTGHANDNHVLGFACRGVDDDGDGARSLSIGSHSRGEEVSLGRRAVLLRTSEKRGPAVVSECCRNFPNDPPQGEEGEEKLSAALHAALPRSTVAMPAPPDQVDGLAQLMAGLQQAILQLSGEMRELRLAFQELRGPLLNGWKGLSQSELSGPMAVVPEPRRGEPLLMSSSCSLTHPHTPEERSCRSASPLFRPESPTTFLDAGIISAVSDGLLELENIPTVLPTWKPRRS